MHRWLQRTLPILAAVSVVAIFLPRQSDSEPNVVERQSDAVPEIVSLRVVAKTRLAHDVADGRRSVFEAAALFAALDQVPPAVAPMTIDLEESYFPIPARTPAEASCWRVARWIYGEHNVTPGGTRAAVPRIAAEVQAELAASGTIRLPDAAALESVESLLERARDELAEKRRGPIAGSTTTPGL